MLIPPEKLESKEARRLLADLDAAQQQYTDVYREILNASPVYHDLARQEFTAADLQRLRKRVVGQKKLLLVYHIGRKESHLLLLGGPGRPTAAFRLMVPEDVARQVAAPAPVPLARALARARGLVLERHRRQPELPRRGARTAAVPLTGAVLRALVANYLDQIADPAFRPTRGLRLDTRDPARPLPAQRPELLAEVLLPTAAQKRILALAPECLLVVPDGALHKLPFEALLLRAGRKPRYVLDEMPPLAYAPSVASLALLAGRAPVAAGPPSLLTVADPAYPQGDKREARGGERRGALARSRAIGLWGQFPPLPNTAKESRRISSFFAADQDMALHGVRATKKALVAALPGRRFVHIAAHGVADDRFGNQFGALVLAPPRRQKTPEDNGFLALHEIYMLPLDQCQLAVLSACQTNVGPQLPLEAGVTLAGGFLAAGARRVVASHWSVDDESTAELMTRFFKEVTAARAGQPVPYARALQRARQQVRDQADWSAPYFWAPFVLVGPAD